MKMTGLRIRLVIVGVLLSAALGSFVTLRARAQKSPAAARRIAITASQNQAMSEAEKTLEQLQNQIKEMQSRAQGLVNGIAVSTPEVGSINEWWKRWKLIKAPEDGKYYFEELPPPDEKK